MRLRAHETDQFHISGAVHAMMLERLPQEGPGQGDLLAVCENLRLLLRRLIG